MKRSVHVNHHHWERGQILPLVAICLAVLVGFAGFAVDIGNLQYQLRQQQTAADAAAIGGAQELIAAGGICPNPTSAGTAAVNDATQNGFTNGTNSVVVLPHNPPTTGALANSSCAVNVTVFSPHRTFFGKIFGFGGDATTSATALLATSPTAGCIYLLKPSGTANFNGANVNANCGILMNTNNPNFNGSNISASAIGYSGSAPNENGANFTRATPAPMVPVSDPCNAIAGCGYLAAHPPAQTSCSSLNLNGQTTSVPSGCYSNLNLNGATVTMNGTYVFTGSTNFNGARITGTDVTIYVTASANAPNFNGVAAATLSPPNPNTCNCTTGGVLYYQDPTNNSSPNFNGSQLNVSGLIYAPGAPSVNFNGGNGNYVVLVFGGANFNGSSTTDLASPPPGQGLIRQATLAE